MRYICYGVGGVGGTICAKLAQSGLDVVAVARGPHLEAIQQHGLRLRTPTEDVTVPVAAVLDPAELDPPLGVDDVVIISTKCQAVAGILDTLSRCSAGREPAVVCCTNGFSTEQAALRYFPRTYGMLVQLGGTHLVPGEVRCFSSGNHGWLDIGCYPTGTDAQAEAIAADFRAAQFACVADPNVMALKRTKLISNVSNCLAVLGGEAAAEAKAVLGQAMKDEAVAAYKAAGLAYYERPAYDALRKGRADCQLIKSGTIAGDETLRGGSSTWQSLTRGTGDIECDFLNGDIALLGRLHGVPTPANALMQATSRKAAVEKLGVSGMNAAGLLARL
jgi:2-dehydropantoate 2-reductase